MVTGFEHVHVNLRAAVSPAVQILEQDKECLAYIIVTYFAGSFLYNALITASDWSTNERLHEQIIHDFTTDYGINDPNFEEYVLECLDSSVFKVTE